jgi:hypothetical protein
MSSTVLDSAETDVLVGRLSLARSERAGAPCRASCPFREFMSTHHDSLLTVTESLDSAMDLLELAVTWDELDYSEKRLIGPSQWEDFLVAHQWKDMVRAERVFGLAADIVRQARRR